MTSDFEKSFKAKLRTISKESKRDPADLWQTLMLERFLARLEQSKFSHQFILKGAILLSKYLNIGRETKDLDFLACNISNSINHLRSVFEDIATINLQDGFEFKNVAVTELVHPHMGYPGAAASMTCYFGKTRSKVTIDIGFGDIVQPTAKTITLMHSAKGPLFENSVRLNCYPKEFIFAEKLETIVYRGASNSRMKDFHDIFSLISHSATHPLKNLGNIIEAVFKHRNTSLILHLIYTNKEIEQLQTFWRSYLRNLKVDRENGLPHGINEVIKKINDWLPNHGI